MTFPVAGVASTDAGRQPREAIAPALSGYLYAALSELPRGALNIKTRRNKRQQGSCCSHSNESPPMLVSISGETGFFGAETTA